MVAVGAMASSSELRRPVSAILARSASQRSAHCEPFLDRYYYDNVIGGPGAFMIPAENYDTFADAILKKLITEIAMNGPIRSIAIDPNSQHPSQTRPSSRASLTNSVKFVSGEPR